MLQAEDILLVLLFLDYKTFFKVGNAILTEFFFSIIYRNFD